jgi:hypothetical protein
MGIGIKRFTKLNIALYWGIENHSNAIALHFVYDNFVRIHKTLRGRAAMEAGLIKRIMSIEDFVKLNDI